MSLKIIYSFVQLSRTASCRYLQTNPMFIYFAGWSVKKILQKRVRILKVSYVKFLLAILHSSSRIRPRKIWENATGCKFTSQNISAGKSQVSIVISFCSRWRGASCTKSTIYWKISSHLKSSMNTFPRHSLAMTNSTTPVNNGWFSNHKGIGTFFVFIF